MTSHDVRQIKYRHAPLAVSIELLGLHPDPAQCLLLAPRVEKAALCCRCGAGKTENAVRHSRRSFAAMATASLWAQSPAPPLVLIAAESHGAHLGALGTPGLLTPRLDALADAGTLYTRCYASAPLAFLPEITLRAGNPRDTYAALLEVFTKKPASVQVTLPAGMSFPNARLPVNPRDVTLPASLPNLPAVRELWAAYLTSVQCADALTGAVFDALDHSGRAGETLVLYTALAGPAVFRGRGTLYDLALHVPLIARGPGVTPHHRQHELVAVTGLPAVTPQATIAAASDQARGIFDGRFHYLRNLQPGAIAPLPAAWSEVREKFPIHWRLLTTAAPAEELYDHDADPFEMHNLAADPAYAAVRSRLAKGVEQLL